MPELSDEAYADVEDHVTDVSRDRHPLRGEETDAVRSLAQLGFELVSRDETYLVFKGSRDARPSPHHSPRRFVPRAYVPMLLQQLGAKAEEHPAIRGLMVPAIGYVELVSSRLSVVTAERVFRLESSELDCPHKGQDCALPSLPFRWPSEEMQSLKRLHLSGKDGNPCVEISNASPLAMLCFARTFESERVRLARRRIPFLGTLKISSGHATDRDQLERSSADIARSLIYELNFRNGVVAELDAPVAAPDIAVVRRAPEVSEAVRYPRTKLQHEVSSLFGFASQATDDPPLAFLSYYQALEYFLPAFVQQSAIRAIRRELRAPAFDDASSDSLLRVLRAAKGSVSPTDQNQLRTLVNEYVARSRLEEFFSHNWGEYFTAKGPIRGVPSVNFMDTSQNLPYQVADRVYQIRNRIVHAKDDPKYADRRVLLPRSAEANAMTPDVLLVRLLATEAIAVGQTL
ncbi:MAG TPA: hypothetical protein VMI33_22965 [Streptosporangiaceae bacterium]|nr:hypothetical protein [Streptosporangiaceae bacterium]